MAVASPISRGAHRVCRIELFTHAARPRPAARIGAGQSRSPRLAVRFKSSDSGNKIESLDGYYDDLLSKPLAETTPLTPETPITPAPSSPSSNSREEILAKARVVFGSRLAGPAERRRELDTASTRIAGVLVPPRPEEPDNCCMSGCVNCVWDRYRDEIEDWAAKSAEARARRDRELQTLYGMKRVREGGQARQDMPAYVASIMDDDGGGSEALWTGRDEKFRAVGKGSDLFEGVPVGIREFMKSEKRLKEKRLKGRGKKGE